jgi:hypothetical protein
MKTPKLAPAADFSSFSTRWLIVMISPANGLITLTQPLLMKTELKTMKIKTMKKVLMMTFFREIYSL